jgi:transporter family protein
MPPWLLFALGSAFFAGLTAVLGKVGVQDLPSNFATFFRTVVVLLFAAAIVTLRGEWRSPAVLPTRSLLFLVLSGLATGLSWLCYYRALQLAEASRVAPIDKLSVAFAIVLAVVFLGERLSWQVAVGGLLITAGAVVIAVAPKAG